MAEHEYAEHGYYPQDQLDKNCISLSISIIDKYILILKLIVTSLVFLRSFIETN